MTKTCCKLQPRGWFCTRNDWHEGPCALKPRLLMKIELWLKGKNYG